MAEPVTVVCSTECTVTHLVAVDLSGSGLGADQVADLFALWGLLLITGVLVLCAKALYNRFRIDHDQ
jgi:hypothetical protein